MIGCLHGAATQPEKAGIFVPASVWMNLTKLKDVRHERGHIYEFKEGKVHSSDRGHDDGNYPSGRGRGRGAAAGEPSWAAGNILSLI